MSVLNSEHKNMRANFGENRTWKGERVSISKMFWGCRDDLETVNNNY